MSKFYVKGSFLQKLVCCYPASFPVAVIIEDNIPTGLDTIVEFLQTKLDAFVPVCVDMQNGYLGDLHGRECILEPPFDNVDPRFGDV